jgi:hypothetical protein
MKCCPGAKHNKCAQPQQECCGGTGEPCSTSEDETCCGENCCKSSEKCVEGKCVCKSPLCGTGPSAECCATEPESEK